MEVNSCIFKKNTVTNETFFSDICIWQVFPSPHTLYLALSLKKYFGNVSYVISTTSIAARENSGWNSNYSVDLEFICLNNSEEIYSFIKRKSLNCVHLVQGLRGHSLIKDFHRASIELSLQNVYIFFETIRCRSKIEFLFKTWYYKKFYKDQISRYSFLAIGNAKRFLKEIGVSDSSILDFNYYIKYSETNSFENENKLFTFIFIGSLDKRKNLIEFFQALKHINENSYRVLVVGNGPLRSYLERYSKDICRKIEWIGTISIDKIPVILSGSDCLILPSKHDGYGVVCNEALTQGVPVICSDRCGAAAIVANAPYSYVYQSGDVLSLSELLKMKLHAGRLSSSQKQEILTFSQKLICDYGAGLFYNYHSDKRLSHLNK